MRGCFLYQHFSVTLHHSKKSLLPKEERERQGGNNKGKRKKEKKEEKERKREKREKRKKAKRGNKEEKTLYKNPTLK